MRDEDCVAFLQWALPQMGLRWKGFRKVRRQVCRRIRARVADLGVGGLEGYRQALKENADEWAVLDSLCNVTISRFFRDRSVWDRLAEEVLPELAARPTRRVRAWSAGCASGEEAYSLSLVWRLRVEPGHPEVDFTILATDRDPHLLQRAETAIYPAGALREVPEEMRKQAFEAIGAEDRDDPGGDDQGGGDEGGGSGGQGAEDRRYRLRGRFREGVRFLRSELREEMPDGPFSLVFCRNLVFTYFDPPTQRHTLHAFLDRIELGGYLVLGSHERLPEGDWPLAPLPGEPRMLRKR